MNVFVFDIKTIPDIDGARRLYNLHGLSDEDVNRAVLHKRRQLVNSEQLPHHLQRVVTISAVLVTAERFNLWSLGDEESSEQDLLERFFAGIARYTPHLVSWNGSASALPVIHYRSLLYPINAERYWETGAQDDALSKNNYLNRYHERHSDLMGVLSGGQSSAQTGLEDIAALCGFSAGSRKQADEVWDDWLAGDIKTIRESCETDVLKIYLIFLNWQRNCGRIDNERYQQQCQHVREELIQSEKSHLIDFEKHWIEL